MSTNYRVEVSHSAEKSLRRLPRRDVAALVTAMQGLSLDPRPRGCCKLSGFEDTYRLRVGVYRIIYDILDREILVKILKIGHRREVYR